MFAVTQMFIFYGEHVSVSIQIAVWQELRWVLSGEILNLHSKDDSIIIGIVSFF